MGMKVLVLGSGGREHALCWKLGHSPLVSKIYAWPGNEGMPLTVPVELIPLSPDIHKIEDVVGFAKNAQIDLVVIGPENYLEAGVADLFREKGFAVLGPSRLASRLESSKIFAKGLMEEAQISTASFASFTHYGEALRFVRGSPWGDDGMVVKVDSLAAGKGVVVCSSVEEAETALYDFMKNQHCSVKAEQVLIEQKLQGREVSAFALCDGEDFLTLGYACDYKRVYDGDQGPNTGGMGAYAPVEWLQENHKYTIDQKIFKPILKKMKEKCHPFQGILFAGLMVDGENVNVLEFNVRLGDPETQVILPLIEEDLFPLMLAAAKGQGILRALISQKENHRFDLMTGNLQAVHVVMAVGGYPSMEGRPLNLGSPLQLPSFVLEEKTEGDRDRDREGVAHAFFAGVKMASGHLVTAGGRVLGVTGLHQEKEQARKMAYGKIQEISFKGAQYRKDIGRN